MSKESISARIEELKGELVGLVSDEKIAKMETPGIEGNNLPLSGTFEKYRVSGEKKGNDDFRHIRFDVKDSDDSISLSTLKIVALIGKAKPEYGIIKKVGKLKDKLYLKGKAVNPRFGQFSDLALIAELEGRKFTAVPMNVRTLPFKPAGYEQSEADSIELDVKKVYEVTLID